MKKMKPYIFSLFLVLSNIIINHIKASSIPVNFTISEDGKIIIEYSLHAKKNDYHVVSIQAYLDDKKISMNTLSGDVNKRVYGSGKKQIIWDVFKDRLDLRGELYFEITAKAYNPRRIEDDKPSNVTEVYDMTQRWHFLVHWKSGFTARTVTLLDEDEVDFFVQPIGLRAEFKRLDEVGVYWGLYGSYIQTFRLNELEYNYSWLHGAGIQNLNIESLKKSKTRLHAYNIGIVLNQADKKVTLYVGIGRGKIQTYRQFQEIDSNSFPISEAAYALDNDLSYDLNNYDFGFNVRLKGKWNIGGVLMFITDGVENSNKKSTTIFSSTIGYTLY